MALKAALDAGHRGDLETAKALHEIKQDQDGLECRYPGDVVVQDTFALGEVGELGTLFQHTFIDAYTQVAHAWISTSNDSEHAAKFLVAQVSPWYQQQKIPLSNLLTDKGAEFFGGKSDAYQQAVELIGSNHIHLRAYNGPVVNGICARFQTLAWNEFYEPLLKGQRFTELEPLQAKLQQWVEHYNSTFAISGRYTLGKSPFATLAQAKHLIPAS